MPQATLQGASAATVLSPGSVVGTRFVVGNLAAVLGRVVTYNATDQRTQRPVAVWAVAAGMLDAAATAQVRNTLKAAATLAHKDLVVPFGTSVDGAGNLFVTTEPLGPTSAAELLAKKRAEGHVHGLQAAWQLLAHVMSGLEAAHTTMAHGALGPSLVRVDHQGHVRVAGLGMSSVLRQGDVVPERYLAPEVRAGAAATPGSDVYSLAVLLFELCTSQQYAGQSATELEASLPASFDIILESALAPNPEERFQSIAEFRGALAGLVAPASTPDGGELDVPIEIDEAYEAQAVAKSTPPPPMNRPAPVAPPPTQSAASASFSPLDAPAPAPPMAVTAAPPLSSSSVDLKALLSEVSADDTARWMFVKGGLDHGPLTARELIQSIARYEVGDEDIVSNTDTGERKKLLEWPQFREFAEQAREKRKRDLHTREVKSAIASDKEGNTAKMLVAFAVVLAVGVLGTAFYKTLGPGRSEARRQAELDEALSRGQLHLSEGTLVLEPTPPPSARPRSGGGGGGGGGGGHGFTTYEAAMSIPVDFNFGGGAMGGGTLGDSEISAPLLRVISSFGQCGTAEMARGGQVGQVSMRIAVGGDGAPMGLSVLTGSPAFKGCVTGIVRGLRWRAFGGPRIGFRWGFSLG